MLNIFNPEYLKGEFHAFAFSHFAALFILLIVCIGTVLWFKKIKNEKIEYIFCIAVSVILIGQELMRIIWHIAIGDFQIQENDRVVVFSLPKAIHKVENLFN